MIGNEAFFEPLIRVEPTADARANAYSLSYDAFDYDFGAGTGCFAGEMAQRCRAFAVAITNQPMSAEVVLLYSS